MNRHSAITAAAIAVIVIPFAYSGFSVLGAQQMEYRWHQPGEFSFFEMSSNGGVEFCNTVPFWTSIHKFEIASFYRSKHLGSFVAGPATIDPLSVSVQKGVFSAEEFAATQHVFMTLDFQFNGGDVRIDPNEFVTVISTDTPILGIIPYSTVVQTSGSDLGETMSAEDWSCG